MTQDRAKKAAAEKAAFFILSGMRIGLGTGSTAELFISALGKRCREEGLKIEAIATSKASEEFAKKENIPLLDRETVTWLDLTVDGADEVDIHKQMIKGGGGALLREKIVAAMSREMIVLIDSTKRVDALGQHPLPVEIIPFAYQATIEHLIKLGYNGKMRLKQDGNFFITENGNYIWDLRLLFPCENPEKEEEKIRAVPGVVETGFFLGMAGRILTGFPDGRVEIED